MLLYLWICWKNQDIKPSLLQLRGDLLRLLGVLHHNAGKDCSKLPCLGKYFLDSSFRCIYSLWSDWWAMRRNGSKLGEIRHTVFLDSFCFKYELHILALANAGWSTRKSTNGPSLVTCYSDIVSGETKRREQHDVLKPAWVTTISTTELLPGLPNSCDIFVPPRHGKLEDYLQTFGNEITRWTGKHGVLRIAAIQPGFRKRSQHYCSLRHLEWT